jgi:hypothetical protein
MRIKLLNKNSRRINKTENDTIAKAVPHHGGNMCITRMAGFSFQTPSLFEALTMNLYVSGLRFVYVTYLLL